jgi:hypothetical protein
MKSKLFCRSLATLMLLAALGFVWYARNHPEGSFSIPHRLLLGIYGAYLLIMAVLFAAPGTKKNNRQ